MIPVLRLARALAAAAAIGLFASPPAAAAAAAPDALSFEPAPAETRYYVGGTVHVGDGTVIENAVIEVRDARIVSVGPAGTTTPPSGANVVKLDGATVTPGLIAASTPLGLVEIGMESSTVDAERHGDPIRASYDASSAVHADSSLLAVNAVEGITSAAVTPRGGLLSGQVAWIDLVTGDHTTIVAKPGIAQAGRVGRAIDGSRAATLARLREVLDDADFYSKRRGAFDRGQSRDLSAHRLDLDALGPVLDGDVPLVVRAHRASDILAVIDLADALELRVVIVGAAQGWRVADALAKAKIPVIVQPSQNLPGGIDTFGARLDNAALLHAAGVKVGIAVLDEAHNVRNVTQEAGIAVANGLPHEVALSAVTATIAELYGMDSDYGTVAAGKVANFVVWDGDPFELSQWPRQVYIRGAAIPMRSRQTLLRDRYRDVSNRRRAR